MPGEVGNAVIAGHRDTHFQFLKDVQAGEVLKLESARGIEHSYEVIGVDIVDFDAIEAGGPQRYVVTARMLY